MGEEWGSSSDPVFHKEDQTVNRTRLLTWKLFNPPHAKTSVDPGAVSRLINAALVDRAFELLLLTDPVNALSSGYNGESFQLAEGEREFILSIRAGSLADFAAQWIKYRKNGGNPTNYQYTHPVDQRKIA